MAKKVLHSLKCLRAIEAYEGGRDLLAQRLGVSLYTICRWYVKEEIPGYAIKKLCKMMQGKVTVEDLLGLNDKKRLH